MAQFNGNRLKKARIYRGYTVAELAEKVQCQRQTLSMYEISKSQPADEQTVERLSCELNFPKDYFFEDDSCEEKGTVYFRSLLTTNKRYRSEQIIKMEFLCYVYKMLQDYIEFPQFTALNFEENITPEEAAKELRKKWNLGIKPIDNIIPIVEQHGIIVTSFSTSTDDVDAFSKYVEIGENPTYIIAYSKNKESASRKHFDIAHELGHICLHEWSEDIEEISKEDFKKKEKEANEFASAFLLPEESFSKDVLAGEKSLPYYKQLKKKWKVSIGAMLYRSLSLNLITREEYQDLIRTMQRRGQVKIEPLDDILITAEPSLFRRAIILLLNENVFTKKEFMETLSNEYGLSINPSEIETLLDLPDGTLATPNIIDISIQLKQNNK